MMTMMMMMMNMMMMMMMSTCCHAIQTPPRCSIAAYSYHKRSKPGGKPDPSDHHDDLHSINQGFPCAYTIITIIIQTCSLALRTQSECAIVRQHLKHLAPNILLWHRHYGFGGNYISCDDKNKNMIKYRNNHNGHSNIASYCDDHDFDEIMAMIMI